MKQAASAPGGGLPPDFLAMPYQRLDPGGLSPATRHRLTLRHDLYRVGDLRHLPEEEQSAELMNWLRSQALRFVAERAAIRIAPPPILDAVALRRWARRHEVDGLLGAPVSQILRGLRELRPVLEGLPHHHGLSIGQVIRGLRRAVPWARVDERSAARAIADQLRRLAVERAHSKSLRDQHVAHRTEAPAEPALRGLWSSLVEREAELAADPYSFACPLLPDGLELCPLDVDVPAVRIRSLVGWPTRAQTRLEPLQLPEDTALDSTRRRALVDALLAAVHEPGPAHSQLRELMATPRWERDLRWMDRTLLGRQPRESDPLGWRVKPSRKQPVSRLSALVPVRCRPTRSGGFRTRAIPIRHVEGWDLELAADWEAWAHRKRGREGIADALAALAGHPRVFARGRATEPSPVRRLEVRLMLAPGPQGHLRLRPQIDGQPLPEAIWRHLQEHLCAGGYREAWRCPEALWVVEASPRTLSLLSEWERRDPQLPPAAYPALRRRLGALSSLATMEVHPQLRGEEIVGEQRPLLRLRQRDSGLEVEVRVRPLVEASAHPPGEGPAELHATRGERAVTVVRDLEGEPARVHETLAPLALEPRDLVGPFRWRIAEPQRRIALVERLQGRETQLQLTWDGRALHLAPALAARDLTATTEARGGLIRLLGVARNDSGEAALQALVAAILAGEDFVQLSSGAWARLEDDLRAGLEPLAAGQPDPEEPRVHPIQLGALQALSAAGAEVHTPARFEPLLHRLREAEALDPSPPAGLQASLRPYQRSGYRWLAQLAHWAPGALLADDMGLGKTVQAIALLLRRAGAGPALVVAPTSLLFNWQREIERFAPSLDPRIYHGTDRSLQQLGPGQVWLTSYGTMRQDAEILAEPIFPTVVLDEAQAIKNPSTQRARAAHGLQAGFRLALSGTPVENRVQELWSLMRFCVPGLLGSRRHFQRRFVQPIQADKTAPRKLLARMIAPFLLRRRKAEVARDLPPRIEQERWVELSEEERALYDRERLAALARLDTRPGARMQVLAALTRLRQLACHPRLVDPGSPVSSSKLAQLLHLVAELRASGHRALIFSQFTSHLDLVRDALEDEGYRLIELRGATPMAQRGERVDRFQAGEADLMLISLKAGGIGLNLTAASFVIHLDPWWNPATEDQATDRAHRIGQDQPVTVYRLIARGTIEERIVELHAHKRALADAVLAGGRSASIDELLDMLRQGGEAHRSVAGHPAEGGLSN